MKEEKSVTLQEYHNAALSSGVRSCIFGALTALAVSFGAISIIDKDREAVDAALLVTGLGICAAANEFAKRRGYKIEEPDNIRNAFVRTADNFSGSLHIAGWLATGAFVFGKMAWSSAMASGYSAQTIGWSVSFGAAAMMMTLQFKEAGIESDTMRGYCQKLDYPTLPLASDGVINTFEDNKLG